MDQPPPRATSGAIPYLTIGERKGSAAVDFYVKAFGAVETFRMPEPGGGDRLMHASMTINGSPLMLSDAFPEHTGHEAPIPAGVTIHLPVSDADAVWARAIAAGAVATFDLHDAFWGDRYGQLRDPFGHHWSIAGPLKGEPQA